MFLGKGVLKIRSKFTGEHPCRSVISIKLVTSSIFFQSKFLIYVFISHIFKVIIYFQLNQEFLMSQLILLL